jgi:hypothetical protein
METLEELEKEYQELTKLREKYRATPDYINDPDAISTPYDTELCWLSCEIKLRRHFDDVEEDHHGFIVNNKFVVSPKKKWRQVGKGTWYRYKNIEDLITYYLKNKTDPELGFISKKQAYDWMKG